MDYRINQRASAEDDVAESMLNGRLLSRHRVGSERLYLAIGLSISSAALGLWYVVTVPPGEQETNPMVVMGMLLMSGCLWLLFETRHALREVRVFSDGAEFVRPIGKTTRATTTGISLNRNSLTNTQWFVLRVGDEAFGFMPDDAKNWAFLSDSLEKHLVGPAHERISAVLNNDEQFDFGPVVLSPHGVGLKSGLHEWLDVVALELTAQSASFRLRQGPKQWVKVRKISYPWALVRAVEKRGVWIDWGPGLRAEYERRSS